MCSPRPSQSKTGLQTGPATTRFRDCRTTLGSHVTVLSCPHSQSRAGQKWPPGGAHQLSELVRDSAERKGTGQASPIIKWKSYLYQWMSDAVTAPCQEPSKHSRGSASEEPLPESEDPQTGDISDHHKHSHGGKKEHHLMRNRSRPLTRLSPALQPRTLLTHHRAVCLPSRVPGGGEGTSF